MALLTLPILGFVAGDAAAQNIDCSAAVQRVLNQTNGQLLSVKVTKKNMCKITVLAEGKNGKRRKKKTVNARP